MTLRLVTWNINSIRVRLDHLARMVQETNPHVLCLQETKVTDDLFPRAEVEALGFSHKHIYGIKGYNGVAILSKSPIDVELTELPGDPSDEQARFIEAFTGGLRVASIYLPNGNPVDSDKFPYKLGFMERLHAHAAGLLATEDAFVLGGDYNAIPEPGDAYDPQAVAEDAIYRPETRAAWRKIVYLGLTDAFRALNTEIGLYSYWDYQRGAWQKDNGFRIDHLLLSPQAADRLTGSGIDRGPRGWEKPSDHTPVWCELDI